MIYRNSKYSAAERTADLLSQMTLHEKVMQLIQSPIGPDSNPNNAATWTEFDPLFGSILSFSGGIKQRNAYQKQAVENTRLGIPILWCFDVIHGYRTIFPVPLAQSCAFDGEIVRQISAFSAAESRVETGVDVVFSPMCEVCRDPRWGRVVESYGEDPYLASILAAASVKGVADASWNMSGCLKHFAGYSAVDGGRDYFPSEISDLAMRECFLVPFASGVKAGAKMVMTGFSTTNGVPASVNDTLVNRILRDEWGFDGVVITDCNSVQQLTDQGFSADKEKQAAAALSSGNDMDMVDRVYFALETAVENGKISIDIIDRAVSRILKLKFELGLFENPYAEYSPVKIDGEKLALRSALRSAVLLKNSENILPLKPSSVKLSLIGPAADDPGAVLGSWHGIASYSKEFAASLLDRVGEFYPDSEISFAAGCDFIGDDESGFAEALECASKSDVIIAALGEHSEMSGEYRSRAYLGLPGKQLKLLKKLRGLGKPLIVLLFSGRPLCLGEVEENCDAMLLLWQGGSQASCAAWQLVSGMVSPSGKLSMSFPRAEGQVPCHYNQRSRCRRNFKEYIDIEDSPQYPFGYGLSYTEIEYRDLSISPAECGYTAAVELFNKGKFSVDETVIWYISDVEAEICQPLKRVFGVTHVHLEPGEKVCSQLRIDPEKDLSYPDAEGKMHLERGKFILNVSDRLERGFIF